MASLASRGTDGVAVGRVFRRAFTALRDNPVPALFLTMIFAVLPTAVVQYGVAQIPWQYMVVSIGSTYLPGLFGALVVRWFGSLVTAVIAQGAVTALVLAEGERRRAGLGECLGAATRLVVPLAIMGAIIGVSVIIGTSLLIVPGIMVYLLWALAPSIEAGEREGIFLSLSRSQELTEGARWKALAVILILAAISLLAGLCMGVLNLFLVTEGPSLSSAAMLALRIAWATILNILWGSVLASLYVELRQWKEGDNVESLEEVFA